MKKNSWFSGVCFIGQIISVLFFLSVVFSFRNIMMKRMVAGPDVTDPATGQLLLLKGMWDKIKIPDRFPDHPRLFLTNNEIDAITVTAQTDRRLAKVLSAIISTSDKILKGDVEISSLQPDQRARILSQAFVFTKETRYAEKTAEILLYYADKYKGYPINSYKGKASHSTLGEAEWAVNICFAYDLIYSSGALSYNSKMHIENDMLRPCAELFQDCNHKTRSNWRSYAISGQAIAGFCLGDKEIIDQAVNGTFDMNDKIKNYGFVQQMAGSVLADGIWYERSMGYHFYSLLALVRTAEAAKRSGVDLWHKKIKSDGFDAGADADRKWGPPGKKNLKVMFDAPLFYVFDSLLIAQVANSKPVKDMKLTCMSAPFALAYREFGDKKFSWVVSQGQNLEFSDILDYLWYAPIMDNGQFSLMENRRFGVNGSIKNGCSIFPSAGYAVLRNDNPEELSVLMTYGKYGSGHDHPDKLHIVAAAAGKIILEDSPNLYGSPFFLNWSKQTIGHNTLIVDEVSQYPQSDQENAWAEDSWEKPSKGELVFFHPGKNMKAVRAKCDNAYDNVSMERTLVLSGPILFDICLVKSSAEHVYDLAYHVNGNAPDINAVFSLINFSSERLGYKEITDIVARRIEENNVTLKYLLRNTKSGQICLTLLHCEGDELVMGTGPSDTGRGVPLFFIRKRGKEVLFASVLSLRSFDVADFQISSVKSLPDSISGIEVRDPDSGIHRILLLSHDNGSKLKYKSALFTGRLALFDGETGKLIDAVR